MTKVPNDRLPDLAFFPTGAVPKGRRDALELKLQERRATIGNAASSGAVLALCGIFCLFYGGICAFAWINHANMAFGVVFSILSGGAFIASAHLAVMFQKHLGKIVAVPERLQREADAEAAIEQAALDVNIKAIFWNDAARLAHASDAGETILCGLRSQRAAIERRRFEVADNLKRFLSATAPGPRAVRPTEDWGLIETIDITTHADS